MSNMVKKPLSIVITCLFLCGMLFPPTKAEAQLLPFGGLVSFSFPCTCSFTLAVWLTPLYLGGPIILSGPLVYSQYSTILYGNFLIGEPGTWELGSYIPGVQACWMYYGLTCAPFPTIGVMGEVGTSGI